MRRIAMRCGGRATLIVVGLGSLLGPSIAVGQPLANRLAPAQTSPQVSTQAQGARVARTPSWFEVALIRSLQVNPITAPYQFATEPRGRKVVLHGRVGTKQIHDEAIQIAIALGVPVVDALVIDTAAAHQAASQPAPGMVYGGVGGTGYGSGYGTTAGANYGTGTGAGGNSGLASGPSTAMAGPGNFGTPMAGSMGAGGYPGVGSGPGTSMAGVAGFGYPGAGTVGSLPYTYPPPLFGRLDDPFFGFEPPTISYPPWWGPLTDRRLGLSAYPAPAGYQQQPQQPNGGMPSQNNAVPQAEATTINPGGDQGSANIPDGTIDMAIDPRGVATLRGNVPTLNDRVAIGQEIAKTPGVTRVINLLNIKAMPAAGSGAAVNPAGNANNNGRPALSDNPPPPPEAAPAPAAAPAQHLPGLGRQVVPNANANANGGDPDSASQRIGRAIAAKAPQAGTAVRVKVRDGVASLSGRVPTVYEAMIAFRAAQQTPGVREVDDRMEFIVPDGSSPNPLIEKGRPEDVEPYLEAQIRRQVGDLAHLDRVRVTGDSVDLKGTLARAEDRPRFDAILRSMPILRGFKVSSDMPSE